MAFLKTTKTLVLEGVEAMEKGDFNKALTRFVQASKKKPDNVDILNYLSQAQVTLGLTEDALNSIEIAISLDPDNVLFWQLKATYLMKLKRYEEAIPVIEKCMEMRPGDVNYIMRGQADYNLERYSESLTWFDKALEIDAENPISNHMKGLILYNLSRFREAIPYLEKAQNVGETETIQNLIADCKQRAGER